MPYFSCSARTLYGCIENNLFQIRKSILDMELDLIAKETQGIDATDLKKKLAILNYQVYGCMILIDFEAC